MAVINSLPENLIGHQVLNPATMNIKVIDNQLYAIEDVQDLEQNEDQEEEEEEYEEEGKGAECGRQEEDKERTRRASWR